VGGLWRATADFVRGRVVAMLYRYMCTHACLCPVLYQELRQQIEILVDFENGCQKE